MRLFSPRKITLLFVIRDKTKVYTLYPLFECILLFYISFNDLSGFLLFTQTPLEILEPILREDIQKVFFSS
jgi:hypothetical protein